MNGIHEVTGSTPVWSTILFFPTAPRSIVRPTRTGFRAGLAFLSRRLGQETGEIRDLFRRERFPVGGHDAHPLGHGLERRGLVGPEHVEVAKTLTNLGTAYGDLGDAARQKELLELSLIHL